MTSFEDRILELTRSEVDRIVADFEQLRKDAVAVGKELNLRGLEIPKIIDFLVRFDVPRPGPIVRPEPEQPASIDNTIAQVTHYEKPKKELTEKQKAFRERQNEQTRQDNEKYGKMVMQQLADGPHTLVELLEFIPAIETKGRMMKTLGYLQEQGRISRRKERKYQGTEYWYSFDAPVTVAQLMGEIESTPKGNELAIARFAKDEGFHPKNLKKMLDEQVRLGRITKRSGLYYNEKNLINPTNGKSKKSSFSGGGVATSGDKVSSSKEVNEMMRKARRQGANVQVTGGDHLRVETDKGIVTIGKTPGMSGIKQDKERLKGIGLNV